MVVPHLYGWKSVKWVRAMEYLTADRRGFWEERGYHNIADPWHEQRYSYQERPGRRPDPGLGGRRVGGRAPPALLPQLGGVATSAACADLGPGVSRMNGTSWTAGCPSSAPKAAAPIWPAPMFSCRSRREPQPSLESLAWISPSRPAAAWRSASSLAAPSGAARSCPAAKAWQVSRHTPARGCQSRLSR